MRITKWGECGILCSLYLAQHYKEGSIGAAEIAKSQGLDLQYTQQILQRLRKGAIIDSMRGPHGGYSLVRPPEEITLKDILYAAEGDTFQIICDYAPIYPTTESPGCCSTQENCSLQQRTLAYLMKLKSPQSALIQLSGRQEGVLK